MPFVFLDVHPLLTSARSITSFSERLIPYLLLLLLVHARVGPHLMGIDGVTNDLGLSFEGGVLLRNNKLRIQGINLRLVHPCCVLVVWQWLEIYVLETRLVGHVLERIRMVRIELLLPGTTRQGMRIICTGELGHLNEGLSY